MSRGLSADAKDYTGPVVWIAEITSPVSGAATLYYAEDEVKFAGNTYLPYLRIRGGVRRSRGLLLDAGAIELINADLTIGNLLASKEFEGALCILKQLLLGLEEAVEVLRGRLTEQSQTDEAVSFRLVAELEPAEIAGQHREYTQLCTWAFAKPLCGYDRTAISVTQNLAEQTADIFSSTTIGKASLTMTVDEHKERLAIITNGTGRGQVRRIRSNTATTLTLYQTWKTTPDATSKFKVVTASVGMPKLLFSASSAVDSILATIFTARTIGAAGLAMVVDEHKSEGPVADAGIVRIISGIGSGQQRRIKTNSATTITIADDEPDFSPVPDASSVFQVLYRFCPKDIGESCEQRGRTEAFNGFPTLIPELGRIFSESTPARGEPPERPPGDTPLLVL